MLELTAAEIDELLREQVVGRIGCHADGLTYVVPVIYAYDGQCVHVASIEGQKVRLMRVYEGPTEVHRMVIARRVLGGSR